jgi:hypothetical protein
MGSGVVRPPRAPGHLHERHVGRPLRIGKGSQVRVDRHQVPARGRARQGRPRTDGRDVLEGVASQREKIVEREADVLSARRCTRPMRATP